MYIFESFESNEEKQEIIYSTYVSKRLGRLILWAFNGMIMMVVPGKELDAHQSGEADHDGDQLSHAGDLNLVLFSLKDLEDDDVDQSSSGQALQDGHCQGVASPAPAALEMPIPMPTPMGETSEKVAM